MNTLHVRTAIRVAVSLAKGHRRRVRKKVYGRVPYVIRSFLRADDKTFHIDLDSGHIRLSLRNGNWVGFTVPVPPHHRAVLGVPGTQVKQLVITQDRIVLVWAREPPARFLPQSLFALDTNESSLDGVHLATTESSLVRAGFPEVREIQSRQFVRRRRLAHKKAHDRRVAGRLLRREGRREYHRVNQRLHALSNQVVNLAVARRAALALEDLTQKAGIGPRRPWLRFRGSSSQRRGLRRRLSSWPRRELHRQIAYKAEECGVPLYWVNPRYTSKTCPKCGVRKDRRSRVGAVFECSVCGFTMDRQLNAGLNIARTVLAERRELGGLRLDPDALPRDVMSLRYSPTTVGAHERSGREGRESRLRTTVEGVLE